MFYKLAGILPVVLPRECVLPHKTTSHHVIIYVYPDTCNFKEVVGGQQIDHQIYLQCFKNVLLICNLV